MKIVLIAGIILSAGFMVFGTLYGKQKEKKKVAKRKNIETEDINEKDENEIENIMTEVFEIKEVKNGIITLTDGSMRAGLKISSPDFPLLNASEQTTYENLEMQFALSLNSSIQFFTTPTKIETKEPIKKVERLILEEDSDIPLELKSYAENYRRELEKIETEKGKFVRKSFCIVGVDSHEIVDYKRALTELRNRVDNVAAGLARTGMKVSLVNTENELQILMDILNRGNIHTVKDLIKDGALELYTEGIGVNIFEVIEKEEQAS